MFPSISVLSRRHRWSPSAKFYLLSFQKERESERARKKRRTVPDFFLFLFENLVGLV